MIKLEKKQGIFDEGLYRARKQVILAAWKSGRPVDLGDENLIPPDEFRKKREDDEDIAYVH